MQGLINCNFFNCGSLDLSSYSQSESKYFNQEFEELLKKSGAKAKQQSHSHGVVDSISSSPLSSSSLSEEFQQSHPKNSTLLFLMGSSRAEITPLLSKICHDNFSLSETNQANQENKWSLDMKLNSIRLVEYPFEIEESYTARAWLTSNSPQIFLLSLPWNSVFVSNPVSSRWSYYLQLLAAHEHPHPFPLVIIVTGKPSNHETQITEKELELRLNVVFAEMISNRLKLIACLFLQDSSSPEISSDQTGLDFEGEQSESPPQQKQMQRCKIVIHQALQFLEEIHSPHCILSNILRADIDVIRSLQKKLLDTQQMDSFYGSQAVVSGAQLYNALAQASLNLNRDVPESPLGFLVQSEFSFPFSSPSVGDHDFYFCPPLLQPPTPELREQVWPKFPTYMSQDSDQTHFFIVGRRYRHIRSAKNFISDKSFVKLQMELLRSVILQPHHEQYNVRVASNTAFVISADYRNTAKIELSANRCWVDVVVRGQEPQVLADKLLSLITYTTPNSMDSKTESSALCPACLWSSDGAFCSSPSQAFTSPATIPTIQSFSLQSSTPEAETCPMCATRLSQTQWLQGYNGVSSQLGSTPTNIQGIFDPGYHDFKFDESSGHHTYPYHVFICHSVTGCEGLIRKLAFSLEYINAVNFETPRGAVFSEELAHAKFPQTRVRSDMRKLALYQCKLLIVVVTESLFDQSLSSVPLKTLRTIMERIKSKRQTDGESKCATQVSQEECRVLPIFVGPDSKAACQRPLAGVIGQFLLEQPLSIYYSDHSKLDENGTWHFLAQQTLPTVLRHLEWSDQQIPAPEKLLRIQTQYPPNYPYYIQAGYVQVDCDWQLCSAVMIRKVAVMVRVIDLCSFVFMCVRVQQPTTSILGEETTMLDPLQLIVGPEVVRAISIG